MKNHPKKLFLLLPLLAVVVLSGCLQKKISTSQSLAQTWTEISGKPFCTWDQLLLTMVASHSWATSCFTVISGGIYDLTSRIGKHPGGDKAILASCGKDATGKFDGQHGMDPKKWEFLKQFEIKI